MNDVENKEIEYDLNAYYLYNRWANKYTIGKIEKINKCSVRMEDGTAIKKDKFKLCYKLTEEDLSLYRHEIIKHLNNVDNSILNMTERINKLNKAIEWCKDLMSVNTDELQKQLDKLTEVIKSDLVKTIKINNCEYKFNKYDEYIEKVEDKTNE